MVWGMQPSDVALKRDDQHANTDHDCNLCQADLCRLLKQGRSPRVRSLNRGQRLGGPSCQKIWRILSGLAALCTTLPDGRRQIMCLSLADDVICPASSGEAWIEALTPTSLCEIELDRHGTPNGADAALYAELFRIAHDHVMSVSTHLVTLGRLDGMERVCLFLADMAWRSGQRTDGGWRVHLPLSRDDIADYLGLNPETVSRILSRVKKARLATFLSPTDYLVPDIDALQDRVPMVPPHQPRQSDREERGLHLV